jgi:hypothetical protein
MSENIYIGFASKGKAFYPFKVIHANSTEEAKEKLKNYYKEKFPEIASSPFFEVKVEDPIK